MTKRRPEAANRTVQGRDLAPGLAGSRYVTYWLSHGVPDLLTVTSAWRTKDREMGERILLDGKGSNRCTISERFVNIES
jgi:hypothetical protein